MSFFVFKHKTAYELRIIDWSSDVCSSDLGDEGGFAPNVHNHEAAIQLILKAIAEAGYEPGSQIALGLDCASSEFYRDRKSVVSGKSVSVRVDLGGRRIIKEQTLEQQKTLLITHQQESPL